MIDWLADPANAPVIGALGLILALATLPITVVGFVITIKQLTRTKGAIDAANLATEDLRGKIASHTVALHTVAAIARIKAARRELRSKEWAAAQYILEELRQSLVIVERRKLPNSHASELPAFLKDLIDYIDFIDRRGEKNEIGDRKKNQMLSRLGELSSLLENIADELAENVR